MVKLASAREARMYGPRLSRNRVEYMNAGLYVFATAVLLGGFVAELSKEPKSGLVLLLIGFVLCGSVWYEPYPNKCKITKTNKHSVYTGSAIFAYVQFGVIHYNQEGYKRVYTHYPIPDYTQIYSLNKESQEHTIEQICSCQKTK